MANSPGVRQQLTLVSGDNPVVPPQSPQPTATFAIIIPPTSSAITKKIKGASTEAGYTLSK